MSGEKNIVLDARGERATKRIEFAAKWSRDFIGLHLDPDGKLPAGVDLSKLRYEVEFPSLVNALIAAFSEGHKYAFEEAREVVKEAGAAKDVERIAAGMKSKKRRKK